MAKPMVRLGLLAAFLLGAGSGVLSVSLLHHGGSSRAHAQAACDLNSLSGPYGALAQGYILRGPDGALLPAPAPRAAVNLLTFDGAGTVTRAGTGNTAGTASPNTGSGTYTVNPDCTFEVVFGAQHILGVLVAGGQRAFVIDAGPTATVGATYERQ